MSDENTESVQDGKVVSLHFQLSDANGQAIESSHGKSPLQYVHGSDTIIPGLEKQLAGRSVGEQFEAVVKPEDAYGERSSAEPEPVPKDAFPDDVDVEPGMQFMADLGGGQTVPLWVTKVEDQQVYVDRNHPLAGRTLHFQVEIVEVRDATEDEKNEGVPAQADSDDD